MKEYKVLHVTSTRYCGDDRTEWRVYDYRQKNFPVADERNDPNGCALIEYVLNFYGKQGWRLVSTNGQYLYLERDI